jgi:hypothetical protein
MARLPRRFWLVTVTLVGMLLGGLGGGVIGAIYSYGYIGGSMAFAGGGPTREHYEKSERAYHVGVCVGMAIGTIPGCLALALSANRKRSSPPPPSSGSQVGIAETRNSKGDG